MRAKRDMTIRERLYAEDIKRASQMSPSDRLKRALELSNLCFKMRDAEKQSNFTKSKKSRN